MSGETGFQVHLPLVFPRGNANVIMAQPVLLEINLLGSTATPRQDGFDLDATRLTKGLEWIGIGDARSHERATECD